MPIMRRTVAKEARWTHQIGNKYFTARFIVVAGRVTQTDPQLHWALGKRYDHVRETCSRYGWELTELRRSR